MKEIKPFVICPYCDKVVFVGIQLNAKKVETKANISKEEILARFTRSLRSSLIITIEGNVAKIQVKGKFTKSQFNKVMTEVRGYGGKYVKGYFVLPIAGLVTSHGKTPEQREL